MKSPQPITRRGLSELTQAGLPPKQMMKHPNNNGKYVISLTQDEMVLVFIALRLELAAKLLTRGTIAPEAKARFTAMLQVGEKLLAQLAADYPRTMDEASEWVNETKLIQENHEIRDVMAVG